MGMFDSVMFTCPKCRKLIEEQSKAGECRLNTFSENEVPLVIALDIINSIVYCQECKESYKIKYPMLQPPVTVQRVLIPHTK